MAENDTYSLSCPGHFLLSLKMGLTILPSWQVQWQEFKFSNLTHLRHQLCLVQLVVEENFIFLFSHPWLYLHCFILCATNVNCICVVRYIVSLVDGGAYCTNKVVILFFCISRVCHCLPICEHNLLQTLLPAWNIISMSK